MKTIGGVRNSSMKLRTSALAMTVQSHLLVNACWRNSSARFSIWPTAWQCSYWRGTEVVIKLYNLGSLEFICSELNLSEDASLSADVTQCSFTEIKHHLKKNQTLHESFRYLYFSRNLISLLFKKKKSVAPFKHLTTETGLIHVYTLTVLYFFNSVEDC